MCVKLFTDVWRSLLTLFCNIELALQIKKLLHRRAGKLSSSATYELISRFYNPTISISSSLINDEVELVLETNC